jgi:hypothetical protein
MPAWSHLEVTGPAGPVANTFLRQDGSRLAVVLPGMVGGWLTASVYYPLLGILDEGFDALCLEWVHQQIADRERLREDAVAALRAGAAAGDYRAVMLVGKSLGTRAMAEIVIGDAAFISAPTIWLTPLLRDDRVAAALQSLVTPGLIVIGAEDPHHDVEALSELEARGHRVLVLARAHHGLAVDGDAVASAEIPRQLVGAVRDYLRAPASVAIDA